MVFNLSVLELVFIGNARVFCAFTTRQVPPGKRKFEELLRLKGWSWHILTAPLLSKYFCHVTFLLWISHGQTGKFVINSHRDLLFVVFSVPTKRNENDWNPFLFSAAQRRLSFDSTSHRTGVISPTGKLEIIFFYRLWRKLWSFMGNRAQ